jgi:hypothetical protein
MTITHLASDGSQVLGGGGAGFRILLFVFREVDGMVLYRLASKDDTGALLPQNDQ